MTSKLILTFDELSYPDALRMIADALEEKGIEDVLSVTLHRDRAGLGVYLVAFIVYREW